MPKHEVVLQETVKAPRDKVFAFFADHEKFVSLFGGACTRIKEGRDEPNGLGSVRRLLPGLLSFDETIVKFDKPSVIHYQITRGGPLKNHLGMIEFTDLGSQTRVDYVIRFDGKLPGIGTLVEFLLRKGWKANAPRRLAKLA